MGFSNAFGIRPFGASPPRCALPQSFLGQMKEGPTWVS